MAILTIDDFMSDYVIKYLEENTTQADKYYELGDNYYNTLLRKFKVNTDYIPIPANVSSVVRDVLVMYVNCRVASDSIEASVRKINQDVDEDPWLVRKDNWCDMVDSLLENLSSDDFYDPENLPEYPDDTKSNPNTTSWVRT